MRFMVMNLSDNSFNSIALKRQEPLWRHSTWKIGGPADFLVEPSSISELVAALEFAATNDLPRLIIGGGSNLLFADAGYRGLVVKLGDSLAQILVDDTQLEAQAGAASSSLAWRASESGLSGIEHVVGIPGTLGGLLCMNGGSLRKSIGEVVIWVDVLREHGAIERLPVQECGFEYRTSRFQSENMVIVGARLQLIPQPASSVRAEMVRIIDDRRRFPLALPSCGSVFKGSSELFAAIGAPGQAIEACGLKGSQIGQVQVSPVHANFITNLGLGSACEILQLMARVRSAVHARFGCWMQAEVRYVCPNGQVVPAHEAIEELRHGL